MAKDNPVWKASKPFVTGSMSGMFATCCIQPMDMIKVRIQLGAAEGGATSPFAIASSMIKNEGFMAMYSGLSAGLTRQIVYTGARLGLFDLFTEESKDKKYDWVNGFAKKSICALGAGGIAAVAGTPADLALIRMQSDSMLPVEQRRNYRGVFHALGSIASTEGPLGLFKGAVPTATRAMALNFGMLAGNAQAKEMLQSAGAPVSVQVWGASAIAGFFASFFSLPFDFVKTQIQKMKPDPVTGEMPFKGPVDCAMQQVRKGGITRLWAGFPTYYFRIAPHAMITLIAQDQVKKLWGQLGM
jgi:solute carrier family 25 oxoglutarate transporter 11